MLVGRTVITAEKAHKNMELGYVLFTSRTYLIQELDFFNKMVLIKVPTSAYD